MAKIINQNFVLKVIIICLCIIEITQGKKMKYTIKKEVKIVGKKHHVNSPINTKYSLDNRKKFVEEEFKSFKLKSEINLNNKNNKNNKNKIAKTQEKHNIEKDKVIVKDSKIENKIKENKIKEKKIEENKIEENNSNIYQNEKKNNKTEDNNYYIYGGGIVSIALVGVGFFNVYQRNRNSIFSLTKEELEALDKNKKINNSYTSLSEEEKRFLHKINARKHNNMRRYDELTEDEILEIRKKNGWADSDDGECQLRRRKIDKRFSSNIGINNTNVVAPRRISLNIKLDKDSLLSKSTLKRSCENIMQLKRKSIISSESKNILKHNSQELLSSSIKEVKNIDNRNKSLSINTKNINMPPIKMICTIVKNYKPCRPDELELHLGDKIEIINVFKDGWASGKVISDEEHSNNEKIGYFPIAHVSEPEIFDDKINGFIIPSPLTPPASRSINNLNFQNSPLSKSNSNSNFHSLPNINFTNSTTATVKTNKSKNRHISMVAVSSSSVSLLTQEPLSINSNSVSSVININNNINIINQRNGSSNSDIPNNIKININVNNDGQQNCINNCISINNTTSNNNTQLLNTSTGVLSSNNSNLKYRNTSSILDPQNIKNLLNIILEEDKMISSDRRNSTLNDTLSCHSQEVFDFLRRNVYNSKVSMDEREYYKNCLERLRISKLIDNEISQMDKQKDHGKYE